MNKGTTRDDIAAYLTKGKGDNVQRRLAELRLAYSEIGTLSNTFLRALEGVERVTPTILPTQASGRWSYLNPPLSGFPKKCVNPECAEYHHEKTKECWSVRDCFIPDEGTFWIEHDLDAVEHRIYALILQWESRINALLTGVDIHTPVTCSLFNLPLPLNILNPHTGEEDVQWRKQVSWQGKDDTRRTMSKNFTYGGQYFYVRLARRNEKVRKPFRLANGVVYNPNYVYSMPNIQSYKVIDTNPHSSTYGELIIPNYEELAVNFVEDKENNEIQKRKAEVMEKCRRDKQSRTLYGGRRYAWFGNQDAAKALFNHIIQGTVASYINESVILLQREFPESYIIHNQHDSLKWAFEYTLGNKEVQEQDTLDKVKKLCQRAFDMGQYSMPITATFKIVRAVND